MLVDMRRTYTYKLYDTKRTKYLDELIEIARQIWNHFVALQRRYYKMYGKYISANRMKKHLTKLRNSARYRHWQKLGSQAAQDVVERLDRSYNAFFDYCKTGCGPKKSPPKFKKKEKYKSFTLKQAGWEINGNVITFDRKRSNKHFKFHKHRDFKGSVKTVTVKRMPTGEYFIFLSVIEKVDIPDAHTGKAVGADFGLKTFLTLSDGMPVVSPQWFLSNLKKIKNANRNLSRKKEGSGNRSRAQREYAMVHRDVANQRRDWFFKLARELTTKYSVICIEDLNLNGMKYLWGRKVSDLAFAEFVKILEYEALINGCEIIKIDRWYPSSKTCHCCGYVNTDLKLSDREWTCPSCGKHHDRDVNAAINIMNHGLIGRYGREAAA